MIDSATLTAADLFRHLAAVKGVDARQRGDEWIWEAESTVVPLSYLHEHDIINSYPVLERSDGEMLLWNVYM